MCGSVWNSGTVYLYTTIKHISKGKRWLGSLDFKAIREPTSLELRNMCGDLTFCSAKEMWVFWHFHQESGWLLKVAHTTWTSHVYCLPTSRRYAWENFYGYQIPPCIAQYQAVAKQSPRFIHNLFIPYYCLDARCLYEFVKLTMVSRLYPPGFRAWIWLDIFLPGSGRKKQYPRCHSGLKIDRLMTHLDPFSHSSAA